MVREDILGALKNAIERNESIEDAKQSLVNSGYTLQEVEEAICELMSEEKESVLPAIQEKVLLPSGTVCPVPPKTEKQGLFAKLMKDKTLLILIAASIVLTIAAGVTFFLMSQP